MEESHHCVLISWGQSCLSAPGSNTRTYLDKKVWILDSAPEKNYAQDTLTWTNRKLICSRLQWSSSKMRCSVFLHINFRTEKTWAQWVLFLEIRLWNKGEWEKVQWLRALAAPAQDMSLAPSTLVPQHTTIGKSSSTASKIFFWLLWTFVNFSHTFKSIKFKLVKINQLKKECRKSQKTTAWGTRPLHFNVLLIKPLSYWFSNKQKAKF